MELVAPRTDDRHVLTAILPPEVRRCLELTLDPRQAVFQRGQVRHHKPRVPAQNLRLTGRQVELLVADVDPHVCETNIQVRITRKAEANDIEQRRQRLIGYLGIDVLQ